MACDARNVRQFNLRRSDDHEQNRGVRVRGNQLSSLFRDLSLRHWLCRQFPLSTDLLLLTLFALQRSLMARPAFKTFITRFISPVIERSTHVLASSLALLLLFWQWRPLGGIVWQVNDVVSRNFLHAGFAFGWGLVLVTTFVINHFDLFGLNQVWRHLRGKRQQKIAFVMSMLYRIVRHPLYVGWFFAFWCTPTMTVTHFLFAVMTTAYILVAIRLEERDLIREHPEYADYRRQVGTVASRCLWRTFGAPFTPRRCAAAFCRGCRESRAIS